MKITAVLSMLHERSSRPDSATRRFRGEAPLAWTLFRLRRCQRITEAAVICWEDQANAVRPIADEMKARIFSPSARVFIPHLDSVSAARRWADGWRGGLLGACEFDRGFHGPFVSQVLKQTESDAVVLVDPSAGLVDPELLDRLIEHAQAHRELDLCFSPAAPGLSGVFVHRRLVEQLAPGGSHPGTLLAYRPDLPLRDAISSPSCAPTPTSVARTPHRFMLDSDRQIDRIASATVHLNGQLISTEAERLVQLLDAAPALSALPRELVIEPTVRRATRPIHSPLSSLQIQRDDLKLESVKPIFEEVAAADDARIVFSGIGDPVLHPNFPAMVENASRAGVGAMAVETDLLDLSAEAIDRLAELPLDIISVNLPAISNRTYLAVMGIDGYTQVMANLTRLVQRRQTAARGTPLIVPTFFKTAVNFAEMDSWYDHWTRVLGCAVIAGPTDYAGQIADVSLAQMEPPRRRKCARTDHRLTILSDGRFVSCEQDFLGTRPLGMIGEKSIREIWSGPIAALRHEHGQGNWKCNGLCAACKDWHRP